MKNRIIATTLIGEAVQTSIVRVGDYGEYIDLLLTGWNRGGKDTITLTVDEDDIDNLMKFLQETKLECGNEK